MLTPETRRIFSREMATIDANTWLAPERRADLHQDAARRHVEYEARFDAARTALARMAFPPLRLLAQLGGTGCLSGSHEYRRTLDALTARGIQGANRIFEHDRHELVAMFQAARAP